MIINWNFKQIYEVDYKLKFNIIIDMNGSKLETLGEDIVKVEQMIKKSWFEKNCYTYKVLVSILKFNREVGRDIDVSKY